MPKVGLEKARETASKLRTEDESVKAAEEAGLIDTKNELLAIANNKELADMYNQSASLGADNLAGESPLIKVYAAGRTKDLLFDGTKPTDGYFYYKPTQEQFKELNVHILKISDPFYAPGMADAKTGEVGKTKFNQVIGGLIQKEDGDYLPFIMYFGGLKLSRMWDFAKEAGKYTHAKPVSIPMFALSVKLTTHEENTPYGTAWVVDFKMERDENGNPSVITDTGKFVYIRDHFEHINTMIDRIIAAKTTEETEPKELKDVQSPDDEEIPFV